MAEYIKREDCIQVVEKYFTDFLKLNPDICIDGIRSLPAADVVEVVRCKDCIHRPSRIYGAGDECGGLNLEFPDDWCPMQCEDGWYNRMPRDDYFCAYGEET